MLIIYYDAYRLFFKLQFPPPPSRPHRGKFDLGTLSHIATTALIPMAGLRRTSGVAVTTPASAPASSRSRPVRARSPTTRRRSWKPPPGPLVSVELREDFLEHLDKRPRKIGTSTRPRRQRVFIIANGDIYLLRPAVWIKRGHPLDAPRF